MYASRTIYARCDRVLRPPFVGWAPRSESPGKGYYHTAPLPLAAIAKQFTLCDHFFHGAFGGSFLNHVWLISVAVPVFPNAPGSMLADLDASGNLTVDGAVTPDHYVVNTSYSVNAPHPAATPIDQLVPNQTMPTIGDRLTDAGLDWAWYSGGWNDALAGHASSDFQFPRGRSPMLPVDRHRSPRDRE